MRVLVACEFSGTVRKAFRDRGHDAWSCDVLPSADLGEHMQADVLSIIADKWDLMIAFPPCTHLCRAGTRWWPAKIADGRQRAAINFVLALAEAPIPQIAIENPIGVLSRAWRRADQTIQPHWFRDPWVKTTQLWLKGLPPLRPTNPIEPRGFWVDNGSLLRRRKYGTTKPADEGMILAGSTKNALMRSRTFPGMAQAMASQWS